jgi:heterotetrameric sarcosine oxidase gamma subunit
MILQEGCCVVELIETPALDHAPLTIGSCTMTVCELGQITQVMPFVGKDLAVEKKLGMQLPKPNRVTSKGDATLQWFGRRTYLLMGVDAPDGLDAAVTDQSDGWVAISLQGSGAEDVLARLVPVDVRGVAFKKGHTMRSMIQHMNGSVTRTGTDHFTVMVMRSMGQTLWHDVKTAMENVASR